MQRRAANGLLVVAGASLAAGAIGIPTLIAALAPAWQPRQETWRALGELAEFPVGKVSHGVIPEDPDEWPRRSGPQAVFVWRRSDFELIVYSRSCTDLGCPLDYEPGSGCFLCPCHGGIFAQDGRRLAGPPKTPMLRYTHRVRHDLLEIDVASVPPAA